jgi:hypothetical protein
VNCSVGLVTRRKGKFPLTTMKIEKVADVSHLCSCGWALFPNNEGHEGIDSTRGQIERYCVMKKNVLTDTLI